MTFDVHAPAYRRTVDAAIAFSGRDLDFFTRVKAERLLDLAARRLGPPSGLDALDVGCGTGLTDRCLAGRFAALEGVDVSEKMLAEAAELNPTVRYRAYDGRRLPYRDGRFDLVFAICVLHHVSPDERLDFAREMGRVVRPGGLAVVFEHNPVNPLTRLVVSRCEFDEGVVLLSRPRALRLLAAGGLERAEARYILVTPFDGPIARALEGLLAGVPVGAQYYVSARRPDR